jgi:hypothetical protein
MEECGAQFATSTAILCPATPRLRGQHDARVLFICGQIVQNWCKLLGIIGFQTNKDQTNRTFYLLFSGARRSLFLDQLRQLGDVRPRHAARALLRIAQPLIWVQTLPRGIQRHTIHDGKKRIDGPPPQPSLPAVRHAIVALIARLPPQRCLHCRNWICANMQLE